MTILRNVITGVAIIILSIILFVLSETYFFSDVLLGNVDIAYFDRSKFALKHRGRKMGYITHENGWVVDSPFLYGTLWDGKDERDAYFIYNCMSDKFFYIEKKSDFLVLLKNNNLKSDINFRNMNEVDDWYSVKTRSKKFSSKCL